MCAGVGAGLTGSIAGLASLISYPALLAVGLGPIAANVTNTTALVFSTLGSTLGSRPELEGQAARLRPLVVAGVLGGAAGATLLLLTPSDTFERIAPWLIGVASLAILVRPRVHPEHRRAAAGPGLTAGVFAIAIYGGYFGAAAGVMVLALMLVATGESLARSNAFKNVVLGVANATAAVAFARARRRPLGCRRAARPRPVRRRPARTDRRAALQRHRAAHADRPRGPRAGRQAGF